MFKRVLGFFRRKPAAGMSEARLACVESYTRVWS